MVVGVRKWKLDALRRKGATLVRPAAAPRVPAGLLPVDGAWLVVDVLARSDVSEAVREAAASAAFPDHLTLEDVRLRPEAARTKIEAVGGPHVAAAVLSAVAAALAPDPGKTTETRADARSLANEAMSNLSSRQDAILRMRFGIGCEPSGYAEIAELFSVSKQRVEQISAKAARALAKARPAALLRVIVASNVARCLEEALQGTTFASDERIREVAAAMDGWTRLAFAVLEGGFAGWIGRFGDAVDGGVFVDGRRSAWRTGVVDALLERTGDLALPRSIGSLAEAVPAGVSDAEIAGMLESTRLYRVGEGYVFDRLGWGPQSARIVRFHRLASATGRRSLGWNELEDLYRAAYPDDALQPHWKCRQPHHYHHLFHRLDEDSWIPVRDGSRHSSVVSAIGHAAPVEPRDREPVGAETRYDRLVSILRERGPSARVSLMRILEEGGTCGDVAALSEHSTFVTIAPAFYAMAEAPGLPQSLPLPSELTTERRCRHYALALRSGERRGYYPAWTPAHEFRLLEWASAYASADTYASLLHVCDPDAWPVDYDLREQWNVERGRRGRWTPTHERPSPSGRYFPTPKQAMAALTHLAEHGSIGTVSINRTSLRLGMPRTAADTLAFLAGVGAVWAPVRWYEPHVARKGFESILDGLHREASLTGELEWSVGYPAVLVERARCFVPSGTWFDAESYVRMMAVATDAKEDGPNRKAPSAHAEEDLIDQPDAYAHARSAVGGSRD